MSQSSISTSRPGLGTGFGPAKARELWRSRRAGVVALGLGAADIVVAQASLLLANLGIWVFQGVPATGSLWPGGAGLAASLAVPLPAMAFGLYDTAGLSPLERFRLRIYVGVVLPWLALALIALLQPITPGLVLLVGIMPLFFVPMALGTDAALRKLLIAHSAWGADVILIGDGPVASRIAGDILAHPEMGLRPIGYCGEPGGPGISHSLPRLGTCAEAEGLGDLADIAVIAGSADALALDLSRLPFGRIMLIPDIPSIPAIRVRTRELGGIAGLDFTNPARDFTPHRVKRVLDLSIAVPALLVALPVILCTAILIRLLSPGPAFYTQQRVGWRGRPVAIFKLRSMYVDADRRLEELLRQDPAARQEWETYVKLSHDPRILPVIGNFIRRTSIDELPQLWNVVRGDISLVGPRPFPAYHVEKFGPEFQRLRSSVYPGLTGLWQVSDRTSADLRRQEEIDTYYIRNWSLWLDIYIVFRTLPAVLSTRGAR